MKTFLDAISVFVTNQRISNKRQTYWDSETSLFLRLKKLGAKSLQVIGLAVMNYEKTNITKIRAQKTVL